MSMASFEVKGLATRQPVRHASRNADSACPFFAMAKKGTLSQHFVTHVAYSWTIKRPCTIVDTPASSSSASAMATTSVGVSWKVAGSLLIKCIGLSWGPG